MKTRPISQNCDAEDRKAKCEGEERQKACDTLCSVGKCVFSCFDAF